MYSGLIASPDLAVLSAIDLSRLVSVLQSHEYIVKAAVYEESRKSHLTFPINVTLS